jgi:hypothetical protein
MKIVSGQILVAVQEFTLKMKSERDQQVKINKYMILLDDEHPFHNDEPVQVVSREDFLQLQKRAKELRDDKQDLEHQLEVIKSFIEDNNPNIADLEDSSEPGEGTNSETMA